MVDDTLDNRFTNLTICKNPCEIGRRSNTLSDLPNELIIKILNYLPWKDIVVCGRVCRLVRDVVAESIKLQYRIALGLSSMEDGPKGRGPISTACNRLQLLNTHQSSWRLLKWQRPVMQLPVHFIATYVYELSGGMLVLGRGGDLALVTESLHYVRLPTVQQVQDGVELEWEHIELGSKVADFAMDVEQDLLILIEPSDGIRPIRIHFRTFSANVAHPAASKPTLEHPCELPDSYQFVIHIVGSHIGVLFSSSLPEGDRLIIYSWTTGHTRAYIEAPPGGAWTSFTFLSPYVFVIPSREATLDLYAFDPESIIDPPPELDPLISFHFPDRCRPDFPFFHFMCRAHPNPRGDLSHLHNLTSSDDTIKKPPWSPFATDREDGIIVFSFISLLEPAPEDELDHGQIGLTFIVHRSALLSYMDDWPLFRGTRIVEWDDWGPKHTRWFEGNRPTRWICYVHGHRLVMMEPSGDDDNPGEYIRLVDFNPAGVSKAMVMNDSTDLVTSPTTLAGGRRLFKRDIESELPFFDVRTRHTFVCSGAMMDDQRILLMQAAAMGSLRGASLLVL